jgi:broad specificity phosphatase PhoE
MIMMDVRHRKIVLLERILLVVLSIILLLLDKVVQSSLSPSLSLSSNVVDKYVSYSNCNYYCYNRYSITTTIRRRRTHNNNYSNSDKMAFWSSWIPNSWWANSGTENTEEDIQKQSLPINRYDGNKNRNKSRNKEWNMEKKVTFVRHGCTYMNEYLSGKIDNGKRFGSYDFTDIFTSMEQQKKYHDTPLSSLGLQQAHHLGSYPIPPSFIQNCDLIVLSPLTRALQTFDIGIKPYLMNTGNLTTTTTIPIIALPEAAERLYLISDIGRPINELQKEFPYVDFQSEFQYRYKDSNEPWWYQPQSSDAYVEWRPCDHEQKYACPGEPYDIFNVRMSQLYYWLYNRSETNIIVVCHHGVIDWMLDISFANCQYKQLLFKSIQPRTLIPIETLDELLVTAKL